MIKLKTIVEQNENGQFYDWTKDFDLFKNSINSVTESARIKFETALKSKILNKSVLVRASKGQPKQPVKEYTIQRVTGVSVVDYFDDWTVVLKNEFNKEYCLVAGIKIKVIGAQVAAEPGMSNTPEQPDQQNTPTTGAVTQPSSQPKGSVATQPQPNKVGE